SGNGYHHAPPRTGLNSYCAGGWLNSRSAWLMMIDVNFENEGGIRIARFTTFGVSPSSITTPAIGLSFIFFADCVPRPSVFPAVRYSTTLSLLYVNLSVCQGPRGKGPSIFSASTVWTKF